MFHVGWGGMPDVQWLAWAGQAGMMVFSCNKKMLTVPSERQSIIDNKVGIVFLTTGEERPARVLLTLLRKWADIELLDSAESRPFARFLSPNGRLSESYRGSAL